MVVSEKEGKAPEIKEPHKIKLQELYSKLDSSEKGLTDEEAKKRLKRYGKNVLEAKKKESLIITFLKEFTNFFAILLMGGSGLAFFAEYLSPGEGNLYIAIALVAVVILNAIFTFIQKYQSEKIMESFQNMLPSKVNALRGGEVKQILGKELVPGDVILFEEGEKISADCRLIEVNSLKVDNSSITGESEPQLRKTEKTHDNLLESRNMAFSGTLVQTGTGKAVVYGTGMHTEIGKIVTLTKDTDEVDTPLHKELNYFIKIISNIAIFLGILFFIISFFIDNDIMASMIFAIGIIVANVPEGLLPTVTLSLTMAAKKMAKRNALIKNLESVETLGSTTVICTDKTGTITQNKMSVNTVLINDEEHHAYEKGFMKGKELDILSKAMVLCNNSHVQKKKFLGDPTETALMDYVDKFSSVSKMLSSFKRNYEAPFDSKTKRMITINKVSSKNMAFMKGAPEVILEKCDRIDVKGKLKKLSSKEKKQLIRSYEKLALRGERVLGFAYKEKVTTPSKDKDISENKFIFIGLIGMIDPPRKGIKEAVEKCHTAGIKVVMVTGDYSLTAEAISRQVGILASKGKGKDATIITGDELAKMSDSKLKKVVKKDNLIFARTSPSQKLRIVKAFQANGEVVTVTGDGVNDAPALKNADMGVSMGVIGTDVAREASDMVLMDDNFATIVNAVEQGRTIFENIKKFIAYILTSNIPEILPFIAFVLLGIPLPLTVVLILCVDLGTDLLPALGLGSEAPESDVMQKKPRSRKERLLTGKLLFMSYGIIGMLQAAAGFFSYFVVLFTGGWKWGQELAYNDPLYQTATTAFFASIIFCQIADVYLCRTRRQSVFKVGFFKNKKIIFGIFTELALLAFISYAPIANLILNTAPLEPWHLLLSWPFMFLIFFGDEFRKYLLRKDNKFVKDYLTW